MKKLMKYLSKTLCLVLALILSVGIVGCSNNDKEEDSEIEYINTEDYADNIDELINFGTHQYIAPESEDKWLVKNGATEYILVIPESTQEASKTDFNTFISEFVHFFKEATNITITTVKDTQLPKEEQSHKASQHYISLGNTTLFQSTGITNSVSELKTSGGKIVTKDNNIYIIGNTDRGTKSAVYTFLDLTFNWECYSSNTIVMDRDIENLKLREYDVIDIPDIEYRYTSHYEYSSWGENPDWSLNWYHETEDARMYGTRHRAIEPTAKVVEILKPNDDYVPSSTDPEQMKKNQEYIESYVFGDGSIEKWSSLNQPGGHNSLSVVPMSEWADEHPEWYASDGSQLCYTCGGDEESYEELTSRIADMIKMLMMRYPVAQYPHNNLFSLTGQDNANTCNCAGCSALRPTYKESGIYVRFYNKIAEKVRAWMDQKDDDGNYIYEEYRRENFAVGFLAYLATESAPTTTDPETGESVPIDETVMMDKNTYAQYANINADYQTSLFDSSNAWVKQNFDDWKTISGGNLTFFMYNWLVPNHNYFYDGFDHYNTKGINYYISSGFGYWYSENLHGDAATEWGALVSYVNAKLCYNSLLDSGKLINNWFKAQFGETAGIMMEMFNNIRAFNHSEAIRVEFYKRNSIYNQVYSNYNWDKNVIDGWIGKANEALAAIEYLKEIDYDEWYRIAYNIEIEAFSPIYLQLKHNRSSMTTEEYNGYLDRIQQNVYTWPEFSNVNPGNSVRLKTWLKNPTF